MLSFLTLLTQRSLWAVAAVLGSVALVALFACGNSNGDPKIAQNCPVNEIKWSFSNGPWGKIPVLVSVPKTASKKNRMPVLIALHGQGESRKRPDEGTRGWPYDYDMLSAFQRLAHPPLSRADFGEMVTDERLAVLNASLEKRPYRGLVVVCPYLPDRFKQRSLHDDAVRYGTFLVNDVIPRTRKETPAMGSDEATGIDGVSLGGRAAMMVGLYNPTTFGAVGGTQAAFGSKQIPDILTLVDKAKKTRPSLKLRLLSSKKDRFKAVTLEISEAFKKRSIPHRVDIVEGNHSYEFNRGPGVYEMLLYYDRVLRGEPFLN